MFFAPAYQTVLVLVVLLILTFILLLSYTFWTRIKKGYWHRYREKFRKSFSAKLFRFVEEAESPSDADVLIKSLTKRTKDISFFLELITEMSDLLRGDDHKKLDWLIDHSMFYKFYKKKLFAASKQKQMLACIYFGSCGHIEEGVAARLTQLSKSRNLKLAYGATKALQQTENIEDRKIALVRFMKRPDVSNLMIGELLHIFHRDEIELHLQTGEALKRILLNDKIPAKIKQVVVHYFAHQNYYEYGHFLLECLNEIKLHTKNRPLIIGLIESLGSLRVEEAGSLIQSYALVDDIEIKIACIDALNMLGGSVNLSYLHNMIMDFEFEVRKRIIEVLVQHPDEGHKLLQQFMHAHLKFIDNISENGNPSEELLQYIYKINAVTTGIRIMSSNTILNRKGSMI